MQNLVLLIGNRILATKNKIYIQDKLNLWIKENDKTQNTENNSGLFKMILKKNT